MTSECNHPEGGEEVNGSMPLVGALQSSNDFATTGEYVARFSFQRLNRRLLVDAEDQGVLRRTQIHRDDVRGLRAKLRVRADAPRSMAPQLDPFLAQNPPYGVVRNAKRVGQRAPIPTSQPCRGRRFDLFENALAQFRGRIQRRFAWACAVTQPRHALAGEALAPQAYRRRLNTQLRRHFIVASPSKTSENDLGSFHHPRLVCPTLAQPLQLLHVLRRAAYCRRNSRHDHLHPVMTMES